MAEETLSTQLPDLRWSVLPPRHHRWYRWHTRSTSNRGLEDYKIWCSEASAFTSQVVHCCVWMGRSWRGWDWCRRRFDRSCCNRCCSFRCRRKDATCSCSAEVRVCVCFHHFFFFHCICKHRPEGTRSTFWKVLTSCFVMSAADTVGRLEIRIHIWTRSRPKVNSNSPSGSEFKTVSGNYGASHWNQYEPSCVQK